MFLSIIRFMRSFSATGFLRIVRRWGCVVSLPGLVVCMTLTAEAASLLTPVELRCDYRVNPLGIDDTHPQLSWILSAGNSSQRTLQQAAYQVLVARKRNLLVPGKTDVWDSGKIDSRESA